MAARVSVKHLSQRRRRFDSYLAHQHWRYMVTSKKEPYHTRALDIIFETIEAPPKLQERSFDGWVSASILSSKILEALEKEFVLVSRGDARTAESSL